MINIRSKNIRTKEIGQELSELTKDSLGMIKFEYCLQSSRDIYKVISKYPYFELDGEKLVQHIKEATRFSMFPSGLLCQNVNRDELRARMASGMIGGGIDGGITPSGQVVVDGQANPQSFSYISFNDPMIIECMPMYAMWIWLIAVDEDGVYQYRIGDLKSKDKRSYPDSNEFDFSNLVDFRNIFFENFLSSRSDLSHEQECQLNELLEILFSENKKILEQALLFHLRKKPGSPRFNYPPPDT